MQRTITNPGDLILDGGDGRTRGEALRAELDGVLERWQVPARDRPGLLLGFACAGLRKQGHGWNGILDRTRAALSALMTIVPTPPEAS